jgi:phage baseplate assembly protein W
MSIDAITLADIKSVDWSIKLGTIGQVVEGIDDVGQCIGIILTTPKGSDPLRPTFGADVWQYIDRPLDLAVPSIVREVTEAITLWEPRVQVLSVSAQPATGNIGQLIVTLIWQLKLGAAGAPRQSTAVTIPAAILGA